MLQRAASNACSWWWAAHIRTKQCKWLEQSLQDMEENVQNVLKLIQEDGDSFAKRAEMYYKKRPELINFVEESHRAFRALADRYDHLSKELQNANATIASLFPEQVQFGMDDDGCGIPRKPKKSKVQAMSMANVPKVPKAPKKDLKSLITTASKNLQAKKNSKTGETHKFVAKSGLSKSEALEEIDKFNKDILALQTVKEFVKSSYENGISKCWGIENQITEMQEKVSRLQDEFNVDRVIEDDEARTLMAEAAIKSCQETLSQLQEKQERSTQEAREECKKIEDAHKRLMSLKQEYLHDQTDELKASENGTSAEVGDESPISTKEMGDVIQEIQKTEASQEKFKEQFDLSSMSSLTVTELAEKIDELVDKVIGLETAVSSQTVLINTLRTEADDLHIQIQNLEDEKGTPMDGTHDLSNKVKKMEEKLQMIENLNENVEDQNSNLQTTFAQASSSLHHLSEKLNTMKPDEEPEITSLQDEEKSVVDVKLQEEVRDQKDIPSSDDKDKIINASKSQDEKAVKEEENKDQVSDNNLQGEVTKDTKKSVKFFGQLPQEKITLEHAIELVNESSHGDAEKEQVNWQQMLLSGLEDREKILLKEYTTILRNYKEVKRKLSDMEKKDRDSQFDMTVQIRELKNAIGKKDEEIRHLCQRLNQGKFGDVKEANGPLSTSLEDRDDMPELRREDLIVNEDENDEEEDNMVVLNDKTPTISVVEEKLRMDIDAILDENLEFWLRFSTSYHQIQKFKTEVQDLQNELYKVREKKKQEGSLKTELKSEVRPIYKHLREIQTELTVWLEQSVSLKDELKCRFASLCSIQEEITKALKEGVEEEEIRFSSHQAAKFQGEILNMKQENNKVREELQSGLDHVSTLQLETEKSLRKLREEFGISGDEQQLKHSASSTRIPLRSFIFGTKPKKQKHSIFSRMHHNRRFQVLRTGVPI
ncbi:kinase-interacting 1-like [Olea europaea subsp. europaea]|uniref:Kinase-interacting 1-like n=1 Tax=Olea europaea subsp. europaea TaxID=158383 RepID=A0A8S0V6A2_OLEEU|nr:kinase-interacting 1-like [Olea europaea subsp. europaea]